MKRNTKQEILQKAKEMFNEQGFNIVSTRDIAGALGISKGNLSYYFKKKEEIVEAILEQSSDTSLQEAPKSLAQMDAFFLDIQKAIQENAFYFWHHAQLSQLSSKIHEKQKAKYQSNVDKLSQAFDTLRKDGVFRDEGFLGEYDNVIDSLLLTSIYWMPFCELRQSNSSNDGYQYHAWAALYPYLTDKGRKLLQDIVCITGI